ncbi:glycosyltransferase [Xanthobacter autotrophicus]|uniref:glycosyltransferase n=1 Tax=Xanthobacter autotrophicus TaxID=280 RepID=UPI00372C3054
MQKPNVLFFISGLNVGGAERHTLDLRARLQARGFTTSLLVFGPKRSQVMLDLPGAKDFVQLDIVGMSRPLGWWKAWKAFRNEQPDIVVAVNQTPLIVVVLIKLLHGTRARIVEVFHTTILRPNEEQRFFLFRWAASLADALVFISANQAEYWWHRGLKNKTTPVILNGIDIDRFKTVVSLRAAHRAQLGFGDDVVVFGLVGAFRPEKSHMLLVEALAAVRRKGLKAKLLCVGGGPTMGDVERAVQAADLKEHVVFSGEQSDVRPWLAACDVGVLCSTSVETFSLAALEFLASGIPMIMSDIGGASEIVADGQNGFLFESGKVDQLSARMEQCCDRQTLERLSAASQPSIRALSMERMVDAYDALFVELARSDSNERGADLVSAKNTPSEPSHSHM